MEFRALGDLEVVADGRAVELGSHQQRVVLAVLVLSAGQGVSIDRLIDALWGARPPATAAKTVHVYISRLRKALDRVEPGRGVIATVGHGYVLRVEPGQIDVRVFERLLDDGRRALADDDHATAAATLGDALALWRGPALSDFTFDVFAAAEIARLEELRLEAVESRIDADLALGRHATLVAELDSLATLHPLHERLRGQLMLALYRCGREPEALELYRRTRVALVDELGIEPGQPLRDLHAAILRQDPALDAPSASRPPTAADGGAPVARRRRAPLVAAALALAGSVAVVLVLLGAGGGAPAAANSVVAIDPSTNAVVRQVPVGGRPGDISAGAGALWVSDLDASVVFELSPRSVPAVRIVPVGGPAIDALAAGAGAVWTMDFDRASATRIDPAFGSVVGTVRVGRTPWDAGVGTTSAAAVTGRSLWAAIGNARVAWLDARTGRVKARIAVGNDPAGIAARGRTAWVTDDADNTVTRIEGGAVTAGPIPVGEGASGIAVGDGGVWIANTTDGTVTRIDPATGATSALIGVGAGPLGIAVGPGAVWVADSRGGSVSRIDPRTNRVVERIHVGGSPVDVAVDAGRVWVTVQATQPPPKNRQVPGGTLRIVQSDDFASTDPATLGSFGEGVRQLEQAICARLLDYPDRSAPDGARLVPEVAAALPRVSNGGRTYTFTIRPGFRFSPPSGEPVTARAFQRAIERFLSPRAASPWRDMADIVGARSYRSGRTDHVTGVTANGRTLTVRLIRPSGSLPARFAMTSFCAVPPDTPVPSGALTRVVPSAGPYYIASHTPGSQLVLRRNPNYGGRRPARFGEIDYRFGTTPAQNAALVASGHADYADDEPGQGQAAGAVSPSVDARLQRRYGSSRPAGRQRYFVTPELASMYLLLNERRPLFAGARMRRAVNFAVDRPALARNALAGFTAVPADQYLPIGAPGFRDAHVYPLGAPDLARARSLAAGHGGVAVMYTCSNTPCRNVAEIVRADLRPLGIRVHIRRLPFAILFERELAPGARYDIGFMGWFGDYADPATFIDPSAAGFALASPTALARRYRKRMTDAARLSGHRRLAAYGRLDADLARHVAPVVAFADLTAHDFFAARIGCQTYQPYSGMDLGRLCARSP